MNNNRSNTNNNNNSNAPQTGHGSGHGSGSKLSDVSFMAPVNLSDTAPVSKVSGAGYKSSNKNYRGSNHGNTMLASMNAHAHAQMPGMGAMETMNFGAKNANVVENSLLSSQFDAISLGGSGPSSSQGLSKQDIMPFNLKIVPSAMPMMMPSKIESSSLGSMNGSFFVASKVGLCGSLRETPAMFNELNSFVVTNAPNATLDAFTQILKNFESDIDFHIDSQNFIVSGMVFMDNLGVSFKICLFSEQSGTRCEITRSKGDPIAFSSFYNAMENALSKSLTKANANGAGFESDLGGMDAFAFPPMSMSLDSLGSLGSLGSMDSFGDMDGLSMDVGFTEDDLARFAQDLNEDQYQVETLGMIFDMEKDVICSCADLVQAIVGCTESNDIAVQRLALKIVAKAAIDVQVQKTSKCAMVQKYIDQVNNK